MVFDLDGDGRAEVVMKTGDGTVDGTGKVIGDANADYRNERGRILTGPEYLTIFNGLTGEAMQTIDYVPERGNLMDWGDGRANRSDRYLACIAYLDGVHPSVVMCRGYYTRTVLAKPMLPLLALVKLKRVERTGNVQRGFPTKAPFQSQIWTGRCPTQQIRFNAYLCRCRGGYTA